MNYYNMEYVVLPTLLSIGLAISSIIMLTACLCCRKKVRNNEYFGVTGAVGTIKNQDENFMNGNHIISNDPKASNTEIDSKRAGNAPHRSLPDIPVPDANHLDTNSDLYATVGDKVGEKPQGISAPTNQKKISVSQHSSISQADDCSSPYARVRSPSHAYDKVRPAEHPYAQVKATDTSNNQNESIASTSNTVNEPGASSNELQRRNSQQSLLDTVDGRHSVIPAASAISGRVAASQELPYMTPPIVQNQQFFSGDSQDSSKGYTSISVREPLANIRAQTKEQNAHNRRKDLTDSHYTTVSDDSDEMYAAIEDPNNLYTSGSETYAQIQPQEQLVVAVEINQTPLLPSTAPPPMPSNGNIIVNTNISNVSSPRQSMIAEEPPTHADILKAAHSRQASSSSCTSSVGNLGSPKPEKRQVNSPLPPTPKNTHHYLSNSSLTNPNNISGRSSVASVIDVNASVTNRPTDQTNRNLLRVGENDDEPPKKNRLSKDLEGMYAKVMKKNKLSSVPSQNTSPIPFRKSMNETIGDRQSVFMSDPDIAREINLPDALSRSLHASPGKNSTKSVQINIDNNYETIDKRRVRSSNANYDESKDPGYETIPADKLNANDTNSNTKRNLSRASAPPGMFGQKLQHSLFAYPVTVNYEADTSEAGYESLRDQSILTNDPGYETVEKPNSNQKLDHQEPNSDYDPNYEVLRPTNTNDDDLSDHYAKVWSQTKIGDANDGYSSIKIVKTKPNSNHDNDDENPGYCTILSNKKIDHDYASISETKMQMPASDDGNRQQLSPNASMIASTSTISDTKTLTSPSTDSYDGDDTTSSSRTPIKYNCIQTNTELTVSISNYESLTGSESDSNYESVRYLNANDRQNPYERFHNENDLRYDTLAKDAVAGLYAPVNSAANSNNNMSKSSSSSIDDGKNSSSSKRGSADHSDST